MTLSTQGFPYVGGTTAWEYDDVAGDHVPVFGPATPADLLRGVGRQLTGGLASRALVNQLLPPGILFVQPANGTETNTFTTRVAINNAALLKGFSDASFGVAAVANTIPAGALNLVGRTMRIKASGTLGTTGTPNLTIDVALGSAGASVVATTGVLALAAVTTPAPWTMDVIATVQVAGSSGTIISEGLFSYSTTSSVVVLNWTMGNTTRGTPVTLDLTAAQLFTLNATCGTSNALNRIICNTCLVELLY
jgi:hypothetical protein